MTASGERSCFGSIKIPVEEIDGALAVGAVLEIRSSGEEMLTLVIGPSNVRIRADHLNTALHALGMLIVARRAQEHVTMGPIRSM